jgi:hypothetical protein
MEGIQVLGHVGEGGRSMRVAGVPRQFDHDDEVLQLLILLAFQWRLRGIWSHLESADYHYILVQQKHSSLLPQTAPQSVIVA